MAWSSVYSQSYATNADSHTFMVYLFDTYLNGKTEWSVSAHPDSSAYKRSVSISLPSPWNGGSNVSSYFWVTWGSTSPSSWTWYEDGTYTTVPGDLGTYSINAWSSSSLWTNFSGDWRIWESSTDTNAVLVTKGKQVIFFWPGPSEWMARPDNSWNGSSDNSGSSFGPYVASTWPQLINGNYPVTDGNNTADYTMTVDVGTGYTTDKSGLGGGPYWLIPGVQWMSGTSTSSNYPSTHSSAAFPRTGADIAWYFSDTNNDVDRHLTANTSSSWTLLFESNGSKYWLIGSSDLNKQCLALDMGTSEPDFS